MNTTELPEAPPAPTRKQQFSTALPAWAAALIEADASAKFEGNTAMALRRIVLDALADRKPAGAV